MFDGKNYATFLMVIKSSFHFLHIFAPLFAPWRPIRCRTWTPKRRKRRPTSAPPSEGKNGPPCADHAGDLYTLYIYIYIHSLCFKG